RDERLVAVLHGDREVDLEALILSPSRRWLVHATISVTWNALNPLPVSRDVAPATAPARPVMRDPHPARPRALPVSGHPQPATAPVPMPFDPPRALVGHARPRLHLDRRRLALDLDDRAAVDRGRRRSARGEAEPRRQDQARNSEYFHL